MHTSLHVSWDCETESERVDHPNINSQLLSIVTNTAHSPKVGCQLNSMHAVLPSLLVVFYSVCVLPSSFYDITLSCWNILNCKTLSIICKFVNCVVCILVCACMHLHLQLSHFSFKISLNIKLHWTCLIIWLVKYHSIYYNKVNAHNLNITLTPQQILQVCPPL